MNTNKISVIIPIYNMQEYLEKCIESVINQTYHNLEVILVDDGSSDQSLFICKKYEKIDQRICIITKDNGGLVSARKAGIERATGEYVTFVDADDWVETIAYEKLLNETEDVDVIAYGLIEEYGYRQTRKLNNFPAGLYKDNDLKHIIFPRMLYSGNFFEYGILPNLVCKLIKRQLILSVYKEVSNSVIIGEDVDFTYHLLLKAKSVAIKDISPYHYLQRECSMVRSNVNLKEIRALLDDLLSANAEDNVQWKAQVDAYRNFIYLLKRTDAYVVNKSFFKVMTNQKVIVYGAGNFGLAVSEALNKELDTTIVGIVDRDWSYLQNKDKQILSPSVISDINYDYIYIAILNEQICKNVKEQLTDLGIMEEKIIFFKYENKC